MVPYSPQVLEATFPFRLELEQLQAIEIKSRDLFRDKEGEPSTQIRVGTSDIATVGLVYTVSSTRALHIKADEPTPISGASEHGLRLPWFGRLFPAPPDRTPKAPPSPPTDDVNQPATQEQATPVVNEAHKETPQIMDARTVTTVRIALSEQWDAAGDEKVQCVMGPGYWGGRRISQVPTLERLEVILDLLLLVPFLSK